MALNTRSTTRLVTALATSLVIAGGVTLFSATSDPADDLTGSLEARPPGFLTTVGSLGSLIPGTPDEPNEPVGMPEAPVLPGVANSRNVAGPSY